MRALFLALLCAGPVFAQTNDLFTEKAVPYTEQELDRRFRRSELYALLNDGTPDPHCQQVVGGLLTLLAETAPTLHKHDETFLLDPVLLNAANAQLNNAQFTGTQVLAMMVRRVMIDEKLPTAWLQTAIRLNTAYRIIDLSKLRFLANGFEPISNSAFTLPELRRRHTMEVERATTVNPTSWEEFRERYIDREVAWTDFTLTDVLPETTFQHGRPEGRAPEDAGEWVALLQWRVPKPEQNRLRFFAPTEKPPVVRVVAHLQPKQFADIPKFQKGRPVTVRGRIWDINRTATTIEIRNALLFQTHDWAGALLADPRAVLDCPAAINEVTGIAPRQPGGFGRRVGNPGG